MGREMHSKGRHSQGQFWWRAAEPIPAHPVPLAPNSPPDPDTAEREDVVPVPARRVAPHRPTPAAETARPDDRTVADLGAVRPASEDEHPPIGAKAIAGHYADLHRHARRLSAHLKPSLLRRPQRRRRFQDVPRPARSLFGKRHALLAAGVVGALLFAGTTGFGRNVRPAQSLSLGIDRMLVSAGLGINEVAVSGQHHTLDRDIFRALGSSGASLLFFDVEAARARVEALPWIESASLVRVLPDRLKVEVRERKPAAVWLDGDRIALVDATGRVLAHVATYVPADLPRIAGPGAPEAAAELIAALARFPEIKARVHVAHRIGERRWDLELTGATRVLMAAGPSVPSLTRLVELNGETQVLEQTRQVVDLTLTRSIAVSAPSESDAAAKRTTVRAATARPL